MTSFTSRALFYAIFCATLGLFPLVAAASYQPGQTLNPSCLPSDNTCIVVAATSTFTAIGIGTSSPTSGLDVNGIINTYSATGGYKIDGITVLQASSTTGNLALGFSALSANTTGNLITAVGSGSLQNNTTGVENAAFGRLALNANTTGNNNTAIGTNSMIRNINGNWNTALGENTLFGNTNATSTVAIGFQSGAGAYANYQNQGGVYVGFNTGYKVQTGSDFNTFIGYQAGYGNTTGSNNIWIGTATSSGAVSNLTTGSQNIAIGNNISLPSATASGQLDIGNIIYGTGITGTGGIVSNGNVGIGKATPYARLSVWGIDNASSTLAFNVVSSASTTEFAVFDGGNAQLAGTLTQNSDQRLKTNITNLDASSSLAAINALTPVTYNWLDPEKGGTRQYGFIAQQVQTVLPDLVSTTSATSLTPDGTLGLNYMGLIAPLVEAVQTLSSQLSNLSQMVSGLAQSFSSHFIHGDTIEAGKLCVQNSSGSDVCMTGDQLTSLLAGNNLQAASGGTVTPPSRSGSDQGTSTLQVTISTSTVTILPSNTQGATSTEATSSSSQ